MHGSFTIARHSSLLRFIHASRSQGFEGLRVALPQQRLVGRLPALRAEPRHGGARDGGGWMVGGWWWVVVEDG